MLYLYVKGAGSGTLETFNSYVDPTDRLTGPFVLSINPKYVVSEFLVKNSALPAVQAWHKDTFAVSCYSPFPEGTLLSYERDSYRD